MDVTPVHKSSGFAAAWWLHPTALVFAFLLPVYILIWVSGEITAGTLSTSRAFFFLHGATAWLGLVGILILGAGTLSPIKPNNSRAAGDRLNGPIVTAIGVLALVGYVYWFKDFILRPETILTAIRDSSSFANAIRKNLDRTAGVASLAQLGLAYMVAYGYLKWAVEQHTTKVQRLIFWAIVAGITFRVFAWAERLALIEALIALCLVWVAFRASIAQRMVSRLVPFMPLIGGVLVVVVFAIGEYFRSWAAYYHRLYGSFGEFIAQRLLNYYYNALNTGAGQLATLEWPTWQFEFTLSWLHKIPIFGSVFSYLTQAQRGDFLDFLYRFGDPEFNNPSGLFSIYLDLGVPLGFGLLFVLGMLAKFFYSYWSHGKAFIGAMYFLFVMTFLELFRYFYLGTSRCFVLAVGLLIVLITAKNVERVRN